jgi:small subunit ribosomal protein S18
MSSKQKATSKTQFAFANQNAEPLKKKYCRFKKNGIKYIDYKDANFLLKFVNEQGKLLPRRITGTSLKFQRKVSQAVKRSRILALMPYVADGLK